MPTTELAQIQVRRATAAEWVTANPILAVGEPGMETNTGVFKIGDGTTAWISLPSLIRSASPTFTGIPAAPTAAALTNTTQLATTAFSTTADNLKSDKSPEQNVQTGVTYTAALLDVGKTVTLSNASAVTVTIPAQATVAWVANTQLNFLNIGAGIVTITPAAGVTINGTPLTLATSKGGSLVRTASNTWTFVPFSAGSNSPVVDEGASTGATFSTLTNPDGDGVNYRLAVWNTSGTLVVTAPGLMQLLVVAGGGGGGASTGGGGGCVRWGSFIVSTATHTVTIGAGGAANAVGQNSILGSVLRSGGGAQGESIADRFSGHGGGGSPGGYNRATDLHPGGGQGGTVYGGIDGPTGILNSITGSSVEYGDGGRGTGGVGTPNRGRGGATSSFAGGSGVVIARWVI